MIGGLQGDFGDLDIKYLRKNISKCRSHISGSFRRKLRHCAKWLRNSPGKRYQRIRICLSGEVETPSSPIRRQAPDVKYPEKVEQESQPDRIPDMRYPEKMERRKGDRLRVHGVGTHPEQLHLDSPRGHTVCSPIRTPLGRSTRHSRFIGSISAHNKKANSDNTDDQVSILHTATKFLMKLPDISDRHFEIFFALDI